MCNLGYCYLTGIGTAEDSNQAARWFERSAEQDYPRALRLLGCLYQDGNGVEKDEPKSVEYFPAGRRSRTTPCPVRSGPVL